MTTSEPPDRAGRPRSDAASRLAALLAEIETSEPAPEPSSAVPGAEGRRSGDHPDAGTAGTTTSVDQPTMAMPVVDGAPPPAPLPAAATPIVTAPRADAGPADAVPAGAESTDPVPTDGLATGATPEAGGPATDAPAEAAASGADEVAPGPPADPLAASEIVTIGKVAPVVPVAYGRAGLGAGPVGGVGLPKRDPVPDGDELSGADSGGPVVHGAVLAGAPAAASAGTDGPTDAAPATVSERLVPARPAPRRTSRAKAVAFGVAVALLALSVPTLGYAGSRAILHSRSGKLEDEKNDPRAAGYSAIVEPTPTALVVQRDAQGAPEALTLLALGQPDSGGSVLFIPLDTVLEHPAIFIDRLRTAYAKAGDPSFIKQVGKLLNEGFGSVINVTDAQWAAIVAPVAPLTIQNPYPVSVGSVTFPAGPLQLTAAQVAPYLDALAPGHDDLDRMARHKLVWAAWLQAIKASKAARPVPKVPDGLAAFVQTLAGGTTNLATLAVTPSAKTAADGATTFQIDPQAMNTQLTEAIPSPVSPGLGDRFSVRVLNGSIGPTGSVKDTAVLMAEATRRLVLVGAQINVIGNAARFGQATTRIEYHDPNRLATAQAVKYVLGGEVAYDPGSTDTVDLVVTLGKDTIDRFAASGDGGGAGG